MTHRFNTAALLSLCTVFAGFTFLTGCTLAEGDRGTADHLQPGDKVQLADKLRAGIEPFVQRGDFIGVVAVAQGGSPLSSYMAAKPASSWVCRTWRTASS